LSDEIPGVSDDDVAIVGTAARFPGARDVAGLWRIFRDGVEAITHYSEPELLDAGVDPAELRDPNYVRASGHLDDVEMFDAGFFGFGPKDAAITDPQHRHFMECCWEALEDAGHPPSRFDGSIGVFAGCGLNSYFIYNLLRNQEVLRSTGAFLLRHTGNDRDFLPTTVSYKLNLTGPSVAVQTACSTSLVATHMGCQSLISGECDMVLAGGVTVKVPHRHGYLYAENEPLDPTGHCRAFDARGAGTVLSSGAGVVVLRRLADAIADGDRVLAVIKGSAINNDGSRKIGYLAPSVDGQAAVVAEALAVADLDADTISYVATHGTGTHVGDPIEISALTQAYRESTDRSGFCFIGSSKANIGHTDNAAGVASLIEVVEALRHRQIPPSINYERPNPNIDFERSPFRVNTELRDWPEGPTPRRAGVSSLGVGGTNAHVILEEAPEPAPSGPAPREFEVLPISAKNGRALDNTTAKLAAHFAEHADASLADAAYTLDVGRERFEHRRVTVCASPADAAGTLEAGDPKRVFTARAPETAPQIDFMFPGASAQYPNMGLELHQREKVYREAMDECLELAAPHLAFDLRKLVFPGDAWGDEVRAELAKPSACLPAIFATEVALARLWTSWGVEPRAMIGHSMGEYTAAHFAGVMSLADAIKIVCLRGRLADSLEVKGRMLSVPLPEAELRELLGGGCELAAANGPSLCTVSGTVEEIEALDAKLRERDVECRRLRVPAAGHSRLLDPILPAFREGLEAVAFSPPTRPYVSNRSGDWVTPEEATSPDYWVKHFRHTVHWSAGLETLLAEGSHLLLEVGPGQTLGSLARQQARKPVAAISSLRHPDDDTSDLRFVLTSFGRLWAHGGEVDFGALRGDARRRKVALPTYGFDRQPFWIEPDPPAPATGADAAELERTEDPAGWFFRPVWKPEPLPERDEAPRRWLVFADGTGVASTLIARLEARGHEVVTVREGDAFYELGPSEFAVSPEAGLEGYVSLVRALAASERLPDRIAHCWLVTGDDPMAWDGSNFFHYCEERGFYSLLHLAQAFGAEDVTHPMHWAVVSNGRERVGDEALAHPEKSTVWGPVRVIPQEFRNVTCQAIDLPKAPARRAWWRPAAPEGGPWGEWLAADVHPDAADRAMAYRGGQRFVQDLEPVAPGAIPEATSRLREGGAYVVTGGLGGLGLMLAEHLAREHRANLVLVARGELPPRESWTDWIESHGASDPTARRLRTLRELEALGSTVVVESADVSNVVRMREIFAAARERFGRVDGVFHAAGVIDDGPIQTKSQPEIERVFTSKVHGTIVLDEIVREHRPDLFVLFSSNSAWLGPAGQVDYAAASAYLNALAESHAGERGTYTVALDWGVWRDIGGAVDTYRRLSGADRSGPPVAHPLLGRRARAEGPGDAFETDFEVEPSWVLDEHRTLEGRALLPGTGYLEMVRGAFAELEPGPAEIRGATFLAPLALGDDESLEVRLTLASDGSGGDARASGGDARASGGDARAFEVTSRSAGSEEWQLHAQGSVGPAGGEAPAPLDVAAVEARCSRVEDAGSGEGLRTLHEGQLRLGPRWRSIRRMAFGEGEAVARLALPDAYRRDLDEYALHPALLDMATGFATPLIEGYGGDVLFAPMSYGRVRVWDRLPAEIVSHVRSAGENRIDRETASFDVTLAAPDGRVLAEIEGFTLRKIAGDVRFGARAGGAPRAGAGGASGGEHVLSEAERVFQRTYELGITPAEGTAALERVLGGGRLAAVSVSPIHLPTLVDRMRSLPAAGEGGATHFARPELETDYVEPRDEVERTLADIWRELLGVEQVGIQDDFFELGGHSLIAVRVFAKIKKAWGVEYPISLLFDAPNIERIAETIRADAGLEVGDAPAPRSLEPRFRCLVPLQKGEGSDRPPFFLVAGMFGNVLNLRHIATHLGKDQPMWAIQARGLLGDDPPHESFEEAARDYLEEVRQVQPHGPYYLGGFSGGGITAFEMAQQLRAVGEEVGLLVLLDSIPAEMPPLSWRDRLVVQWQRLRQQGPRYLARWLRNRIRWEIEKRQRRTGEADAPRDLSPAEFRSGQIEAAFRRSLARYHTGVYDGEITLVRPPQDGLVPLGGGRFLLPVSREVVDAENNWAAHAERGVRVEVVPGDHDSMVLEPNVRVLAAKLQRRLDEAMGGEGRGSEG
jgi:acyl transferase domain-containing protein/thioesterase domain-containing protein